MPIMPQRNAKRMSRYIPFSASPTHKTNFW
jgi:hypothetical protein